jgi:hypothetical protein
MPLPSDLSFVGVAKEATKGTFAASTKYPPMKTFNPHDKQIYLVDQGQRGSMATNFGQTAGPVFSEIDMGGDVFPDTWGFFLAGMLGDVVTTGATAPFSHAMAVKNNLDGQPVALSLTDFYGLTGGTPARGYAGVQMSDLEVDWQADGLLKWTGKGTGFASALVAKPTAAYTAITTPPAWVGTTSIGGSNSLILEAGKLVFKRPVKAIHSVDGTAAPYKIWVGPLTVTGSLTLIHEDDTELIRYLTNTQPALVLDFSQGAGAALTEVKFTMTKAAYTLGDIVRGNDYVETTVNIEPVANSTDVGASAGFSPVKAVLQNALPASTYV